LRNADLLLIGRFTVGSIVNKSPILNAQLLISQSAARDDRQLDRRRDEHVIAD